MQVTTKAWNEYVTRLSRINQKAGQLMRKYIDDHGTANTNDLIHYAYGLVTKYGEGSAELACQMYEALAEAQGAMVQAAEPAETASYSEVARMVYATKDQNPANMSNGVSRLVKRAGADTTLKNAIRDGAEWAWVPHGDTCSFCITLASRGWQKASNKMLKGGHAEHIHANCDCEFAIRFDHSTTVAGYDPDKYLEQYNAAGGNISKMRRMAYASRKDEINAQKRATYAKNRNRIVTGGRNPDSNEASEHAKLYYEEIRKRNSDVSKIAKNTGYSEKEIEEIKKYIFYDKHDLGNGKEELFYPDYMMAESWRRLQEGDPLSHDLTLLKHEKLEKEYMTNGYSQYDAHILASKSYNYSKEAREYYGSIKKHRKEK